jgi:hypothetical protein
MTQNITISVHVYISSPECRKKVGERKRSILERGEGRQLHQLLTGPYSIKYGGKQKMPTNIVIGKIWRPAGRPMNIWKIILKWEIKYRPI